MFPDKDLPKIYECNGNADIQVILKQVDPFLLLKKIAEFRKLNFDKMSEVEIGRAITDVLCWNGLFACYTNMQRYREGTKFFRVKKLEGPKLPNPRFGKYKDYWETESKYIKNYSRINKPGESMLYVSSDLRCSIGEVKVKKDEFFVAIQYTAKSEVKVNMIGGEFDYDAMGVFDGKVKLIHEMYNSFLRDEFSRDVGEGTEYLYKISEQIAKMYYDLPPRLVQDAWAYTSVKDKNKYNVCFRPEIARDILKLDGAMICKLDEKDEIRVYTVAVGADEKENILFYPMGSDEQKKTFPHLKSGKETD